MNLINVSIAGRFFCMLGISIYDIAHPDEIFWN
jgi:hypothetical protein